MHPLLQKAFHDEFVQHATKALKAYDSFLKAAGNGFAQPSGLTLADFVIANHVLTIKKCDPQLAGQFPDLVAHSDRIHALPQLKAYLAQRPDTFN